MVSIRKIFQVSLLSIIFLMAHVVCPAQNVVKVPFEQEGWKPPYEPFRIAGNLYYVGTYDLACYLITTPKGHILINTGLAESVPMIKASIEKLGFKFSDIKILLATHAHFDHVAGMAEIKKATGAKMMINEKDAAILGDGGSSDYALGGNGMTFEPVKADVLLHAHDTIKWGGMQIIALNHPGHTKGATSFLFDVKDEHRSYRVLIANMPSILDRAKFPTMPDYPEIGKDYAYTFDDLKKQQFDIWLSSHAAQFNLHKKHKPGDAYNPEAFFDRKGYDEEVESLYQIYLQKIGNN